MSRWTSGKPPRHHRAAGEPSEPGERAPARSATPADLTKLEAVLADDPTLDDDLAEWHSDVVRQTTGGDPGPRADHRPR